MKVSVKLRYVLCSSIEKFLEEESLFLHTQRWAFLFDKVRVSKGTFKYFEWHIAQII